LLRKSTIRHNPPFGDVGNRKRFGRLLGAKPERWPRRPRGGLLRKSTFRYDPPSGDGGYRKREDRFS
jgi:hypothetical protein